MMIQLYEGANIEVPYDNRLCRIVWWKSLGCFGARPIELGLDKSREKKGGIWLFNASECEIID